MDGSAEKHFSGVIVKRTAPTDHAPPSAWSLCAPHAGRKAPGSLWRPPGSTPCPSRKRVPRGPALVLWPRAAHGHTCHLYPRDVVMLRLLMVASWFWHSPSCFSSNCFQLGVFILLLLLAFFFFYLCSEVLLSIPPHGGMQMVTKEHGPSEAPMGAPPHSKSCHLHGRQPVSLTSEPGRGHGLQNHSPPV